MESKSRLPSINILTFSLESCKKRYLNLSEFFYLKLLNKKEKLTKVSEIPLDIVETCMTTVDILEDNIWKKPTLYHD